MDILTTLPRPYPHHQAKHLCVVTFLKVCSCSPVVRDLINCYPQALHNSLDLEPAILLPLRSPVCVYIGSVIIINALHASSPLIITDKRIMGLLRFRDAESTKVLNFHLSTINSHGSSGKQERTTNPTLFHGDDQGLPGFQHDTP